MQHEPRCPALGAREPRQGDYDDDEAGVVQVLSHQVVLDTRNVVARVESCRRRRRRRAHSEVAHNTWHSGDSISSISISSRGRRDREAGERHEVVVQEKVQVARQEEEAEAEVVDYYYERVALPLLLSLSRNPLAAAAGVVVVAAATTAAAATIAVSVGRGTLVQGNF